MSLIKYPIPHAMSAEIVISDEKGNIEQIIKAKSFVKHLIYMLSCSIGETSNATAVDTGGTTRTMTSGTVNNIMLLTSGAGDNTNGVVVGTGTAAVTVSDNKLQTIIANGVGAGQLSYNAESITSPVTVGSDRYFEVSRALTNNSGSDITVNEVALYFQANSFKFCMDRSLTTFTITNGTSKTVTYRIKVTV